MELELIKATTQRFETILELALEQKYFHYSTEIRDSILQFNPVRRWRLNDFVNLYISANCFPVERLEELVHQLFDIKLQLYYIHEVDLALYNSLVHDRGYDPNKPLVLPHVLLTRLSFDQSLIAKSRILWERIMNFIYFLENGRTLQGKGGKKSKRRAFFDFVRGCPRWRFLEPYEAVLQQYEDCFRTPEFHCDSVLRAELLGNRNVRANKLLELLNRSMNNVWENVLSIVGGGKARSFTDLHGNSEHMIDPKYVE